WCAALGRPAAGTPNERGELGLHARVRDDVQAERKLGERVARELDGRLFFGREANPDRHGITCDAVAFVWLARYARHIRTTRISRLTPPRRGAPPLAAAQP